MYVGLSRRESRIKRSASTLRDSDCFLVSSADNDVATAAERASLCEFTVH